MKTKTLLLFSGLVLFASCKDQHEKAKWLPDVTNEDHGPLSEKEYAGDFDEIEVSQSITAEMIKSDVEKIVISAPANIIDEILVERNGNRVHIHYQEGIRVMNNTRVTAKIYVKDFTKITGNSGAEIILKDKFTQEKTEIELSSSASLSGHIEANDLDMNLESSSSFDGKIWAVDFNLEASSGSSADISGKTKNAEISASSGSDISAKGVVAQNLKAESSSGSDVKISVSENLDAQASSGASITAYKKGNGLMVKKEESSGGSVTVQ